MDKESPKAKESGIKSWPKDDRPREKLLLKGAEALSDAELIAILLGSGITQGKKGEKEKTALDLAREVLALADQNLVSLSRLSVQDYMKLRGIGEAKAVTLAATLELGRRRQSASLDIEIIRNSGDAARILQPLLADYRHEVFMVLFLAVSKRVIYKEKISEGGLKGTIVDIKIVVRKAIEKDADSMILCHNHPSGNLRPSQEDIRLTKKIADAAKLIDTQVIDHLIVSSQGYFSFADEGLL